MDSFLEFLFDLDALLFRCCLMVLVISCLLWPVQDRFGCIWMVVVGSIWLLKVLYGFRCFLPVLNDSGRFWLDMSILFLGSGSI